MEIKTKFNVGETIYPISFDIDKLKWFVEPYTLELSVDRICILDTGICYDTYFKWFAEEDCFATEAEAQAECDRRNNGK